MSDVRLFDYDPMTGVRTLYEDTPEGFQLKYEQDVEQILELNKTKQKMGREYYANDPEMWRVASIPVVVQMKWMIEKGVDVYNADHWPAVKKLLNDPEWRYLKTAEIII